MNIIYFFRCKFTYLNNTRQMNIIYHSIKKIYDAHELTFVAFCHSRAGGNLIIIRTLLRGIGSAERCFPPARE